MKKCIIIAEAGVNHNGSIFLAKKLIDIAAKAKADYVKFQSFNPNNLVTKKVRVTKYQKTNQPQISTQYEMLKKYELSYKNHLELISHCKKKKIKFLSTAFDIASLKMLMKFKLNIIKSVITTLLQTT